MEELLKGLEGKRIDVSYGTSAVFRGDVLGVKNGILSLRDEDDRIAYIAIEKIAFICERDESHTRPGFII